MTQYASWRDVPEKDWRWENFSPRELACKGTGSLLVVSEAMDKLQALRDKLGVPMIVTSAYRSPQHNRNVGGASRSLHMQGTAFDIRMENHNPSAFEAAAREVGFTGFGYYPRSGFMHIDTGAERTWGTPFPHSDTNLPPEAPRRAENVKEDRDLQVLGGGTALVLANEALKPQEDGVSLLDRLLSIDPVVLVVLAVVGFVAWRHFRGAPK